MRLSYKSENKVDIFLSIELNSLETLRECTLRKLNFAGVVFNWLAVKTP